MSPTCRSTGFGGNEALPPCGAASAESKADGSLMFERQPILRGRLVTLRPLSPSDRDDLYDVASDPLIWEQHPCNDRHERDSFNRFFDESLESGGALAVLDRAGDRIIGSSRYHGVDLERSEVEIGWTFLARSYWGGRYNGEIKRLMLEHAFRFVDSVVLLVSPANVRSQRAVEKIGGRRDGYRLDASGRNSFLYRIRADEHAAAYPPSASDTSTSSECTSTESR